MHTVHLAQMMNNPTIFHKSDPHRTVKLSENGLSVWSKQGCLEGVALGHAPPPQESKFYLDIGLSQKKVSKLRSIFNITSFAPPQTISKYTPEYKKKTITKLICITSLGIDENNPIQLSKFSSMPYVPWPPWKYSTPSVWWGYPPGLHIAPQSFDHSDAPANLS